MKQKRCFIDIFAVRFAQDGKLKVSTHSASDCKNSVKKRVTLGMVKNVHLQPDHVQENLCNIKKIMLHL